MLAFVFLSVGHAQPSGGTGPVRRAAPRFEDLRVPTPIPARKKRAEIADRAPDVDKQLSDAAKEGPDFAGHFFISEWTCGSFCNYIVIVDVATMKVYGAPFAVAYFMCNFDGRPVVYRLDSSLLVVHGSIETHDAGGREVRGPCGTFYYNWDGHALKLIHSVIPRARAVER